MRSTSGIDDVIVEEIDHLVDSRHQAIACSRWELVEKYRVRAGTANRFYLSGLFFGLMAP
jgi:hypothetical protein